MDMNAIDKWCIAERDGSWRAFNEYSGAVIQCPSEGSAKAVKFYFEEMVEIGLCGQRDIDEAEQALSRFAPYAADLIQMRYDNAVEEIESLMDAARAEFGY